MKDIILHLEVHLDVHPERLIVHLVLITRPVSIPALAL